MISFRNWNDEANFILAFSNVSDHKGTYGFFLELFRRRVDIQWRKRKDIQWRKRKDINDK